MDEAGANNYDQRNYSERGTAATSAANKSVWVRGDGNWQPERRDSWIRGEEMEQRFNFLPTLPKPHLNSYLHCRPRRLQILILSRFSATAISSNSEIGWFNYTCAGGSDDLNLGQCDVGTMHVTLSPFKIKFFDLNPVHSYLVTCSWAPQHWP